MIKTRLLGVVLPLALLAGPANAALLTYTISGGYAASFQLDQQPDVVVDQSDPGGAFFIFDVPGIYGGKSGLGGLTFYAAGNSGGLTVTFLNPDTNSFEFADPIGPQFYTGPLDKPTLLAFGPRTFHDYYDPSRLYVISAVVNGAVPEPASWAMMIAGFGLAGGVVRRRRVAFA